MSELKKMTEKELLGMTLAELGFTILKSDGVLQIFERDFYIKPVDLGIELIPEAPEVTQENLQLFWDKYECFPFANFGKNKDQYGSLVYISSSGYISSNRLNDPHVYCEITDKRWTEIAEAGNE